MKRLYDHSGQAVEEIEGIQVVVDYTYTAPCGCYCGRGHPTEPPEGGQVEIGAVVLANDKGCSDISVLMVGAYLDLLAWKIKEEVEND